MIVQYVCTGLYYNSSLTVQFQKYWRRGTTVIRKAMTEWKVAQESLSLDR